MTVLHQSRTPVGTNFRVSTNETGDVVRFDGQDLTAQSEFEDRVLASTAQACAAAYAVLAHYAPDVLRDDFLDDAKHGEAIGISMRGGGIFFLPTPADDQPCA